MRDRFRLRPDWWFGHTYAVETERGLDDREDLYTPGPVCAVGGATKSSITLWAAAEPVAGFELGPGDWRRRRGVVKSTQSLADHPAA